MPPDDILLKLRERIVAFAASRVERGAAEDLAQEVLIVLHDKYPDVVDIGELVPLAMQIMRFKLTASLRKAVRRGETGAVSLDEIQVPDQAGDFASELERRELLDRLTTALSHMGERCRELFRLKLLGRSFAEIQTAMKASSINTVYTWDLRCREELKTRVGGSWSKTR